MLYCRPTASATRGQCCQTQPAQCSLTDLVAHLALFGVFPVKESEQLKTKCFGFITSQTPNKLYQLRCWKYAVLWYLRAY